MLAAITVSPSTIDKRLSLTKSMIATIARWSSK
jgi:hypothetical protein